MECKLWHDTQTGPTDRSPASHWRRCCSKAPDLENATIALLSFAAFGIILALWLLVPLGSWPFASQHIQCQEPANLFISGVGRVRVPESCEHDNGAVASPGLSAATVNNPDSK